MALAYRAGSFVSAGNSSGSALTLTKPTGTADGDVVLVLVYFEPDTNTIAVSGGTWETVTIANTGAFKLQAFVRTAASEPASYSVTATTMPNWRTAVGAAYSGGTGAGTRIDASSTAQADGQGIGTGSQEAPSVTTTGADRMVDFGYTNFSGSNPTALTGFAANLRGAFGATTIGDALKATAGASGTTRVSAGPGTETWAALHVALISDTGGGGGGFDPATVPPPVAPPFLFPGQRVVGY